MTDSSHSDFKDRIVCFCHCVTLKTLLEAIRAGADTHQAIQTETHASTGCGGCECEVLAILEAELKKIP